MPSPIAHTAIAYALYRVFRTRMPPQAVRPIGLVPGLLPVTIGLSLLPDLDALLGMLMGNVGRFHNNVSHSLFFGVIVALPIGGVAWLRHHAGFFRWFLLALLCYELHVMMDFFTAGRGVMLLWPFSPDRYAPPFYVFYGVHWSEGWLSLKHVWTAVTELASVMFTVFMVYVWHKNKSLGSTSMQQQKDTTC